MLENGTRVLTVLGSGTVVGLDICHERVKSPKGALKPVWSKNYGYRYEVELDNKSKEIWIFSPGMNPCFWESDLTVIESK